MLTLIDDHRAQYGVEPIRAQLPIAPSTYFDCKARQADPARLPERVRCDAELAREIRRAHEANFRVDGARNAWRQLGRENVVAAHCTAERPLDRANRQFKASRPNES